MHKDMKDASTITSRPTFKGLQTVVRTRLLQFGMLGCALAVVLVYTLITQPSAHQGAYAAITPPSKSQTVGKATLHYNDMNNTPKWVFEGRITSNLLSQPLAIHIHEGTDRTNALGNPPVIKISSSSLTNQNGSLNFRQDFLTTTKGAVPHNLTSVKLWFVVHLLNGPKDPTFKSLPFILGDGQFGSPADKNRTETTSFNESLSIPAK